MVIRPEEPEAGSLAQLARVIVERHPAPIIVLTEDRRVVLWNGSARRRFGFSSTEAIGRLVQELVSPSALRKQLHAEPVRAGNASFVVLTHGTASSGGETAAASPAAATQTSSLTKRQSEVLGLLAGGYRSKEIAAKLEIGRASCRERV